MNKKIKANGIKEEEIYLNIDREIDKHCCTCIHVNVYSYK